MSTPQKTASDASTWANGFFSCCSPGGLCILTICCSCITYGKTQHRVKYGSLDDYSCCNSSCIVFCLAAHLGLQCFPAMMQRKLIRNKFNLKGSWLGDFCRSGACTCCVLMQNEKESEQRISARASQPYMSHEQMVYPQ
ncbi:PLAC8 domain-containing protein [Trichoderma barbatum]